VTQTDFRNEFNLARLARHPQKLDEEGDKDLKSHSAILRILKILVYKIGLSFERQDILTEQLNTKIKKVDKDHDEKL